MKTRDYAKVIQAKMAADPALAEDVNAELKRLKRRYCKPQHEDGVPSPHGFVQHPHETLPGGRIHFDADHQEWVALALDRVLGRFRERDEAIQAVSEHAKKPKGHPPTTDPNRYEARQDDCDDWRD